MNKLQIIVIIVWITIITSITYAMIRGTDVFLASILIIVYSFSMFSLYIVFKKK